MQVIQVTATTTGTVPILPPAYWNGPVKPSVPFQWMTVWNKGTNAMMIGDASTSSTHGAPLSISGALTFGPALHEGQNLNEWYIYVVSGDTYVVIYQE